MKYPLKTITLLIALLTGLSPLTACASADTDAETKESTADTTPAEPEEPEFSDNLPDVTYDGYEFRLFIRESSQGGRGASLYSEEMTGDLLNDIVYQRNMAVEERFDVSFLCIHSADAEYGTDCTATIIAGDDAYDLLAPHGRFAFDIALQGLTYEWGNLPYVDLNREWWDANINKSFTIHDKLYTTTGDICYYSVGSAACLFFNKSIFDEYKIAYPYDAVIEGRWTWDEWEKIIEETTADLDGDGVMNWEKDRLGYVTSMWGGPINMQFAGGISIITITDGIPEITFMNERTVEVFQRYFKQITPGVNIDIPHKDAFMKGNVTFLNANINSAVTYREMEDDFGIIPFPKYSEEMEYRTNVDGGANLFLVPITVTDLERNSVIIEGMASESCRNTIPQYYEVVLKTKHVRDPESTQVIDIIKNSRVFDFGYYNMSIGLDSIPVNLYQASGNADNIASFYKSKEKQAVAELDALIEKYNKIAELQAEVLEENER